VGEFQIALAVVSSTGAPLTGDAVPETLRALLAAESKRYRLTEPAQASWRVVVDGQRVHLRAADHAGVSDLLDVDPARLRSTLDRIRRIETLRRVSGSSRRADDQLDVWIERRLRGSTKAARLSERDVLRPGDEVQVKLKKSGGRIYDVTVLYLDANYGIQCLFPRRAQRTPRAQGRQGPRPDGLDHRHGRRAGRGEPVGRRDAAQRERSRAHAAASRGRRDHDARRRGGEGGARPDRGPRPGHRRRDARPGLAAPAKETATGSVFLVPT
jgi:hypothetical protein